MFYSDTFPQIIQCCSLPKEKMLSGFAIGHPGQRRVPQLVRNKLEGLNYELLNKAYRLRLRVGCAEIWTIGNS